MFCIVSPHLDMSESFICTSKNLKLKDSFLKHTINRRLHVYDSILKGRKII
jgi:hypothetical protein